MTLTKQVSGWKQLFKSKRWRLVVQILKRILNKRNLKSNYTKEVVSKKEGWRNETHANSGAEKNVLCAKKKMN